MTGLETLVIAIVVVAIAFWLYETWRDREAMRNPNPGFYTPTSPADPLRRGSDTLREMQSTPNAPTGPAYSGGLRPMIDIWGMGVVGDSATPGTAGSIEGMV